MVDILATVSDPAANSYFTLAEADAAMDGYVNGSKWLNLDETKRTRFILQATRLVDRFKVWPPKQVVSPVEQSLAFPTAKDPQGVVRTEVLNAVLETLDYLASGKMVALKKLQAEGVKQSSMLGQNASFDVDFSELPAGARNELLKVWKSYSGPMLVAKPVQQARRSEPTTDSLYESGSASGLGSGEIGSF